MVPQCRALELSDPTAKTPCDKPTTSLDGRLCGFHSRQCQALYRGYKKRNAQLDKLVKSMPKFLVDTKTALNNQAFEEVDSEVTLRELHSYLFTRMNLLGSVIRARKLHHSHFFAGSDNDYGHEKFLAQLQSEKHTVTRALERLGRRTADLLYKQQRWFNWVRQCQDDEASQREKESMKVKLEAQLFRRHQKEVFRHQNEVRAREKLKREEAFLDELYTQRLSEMTEAEQEEWDPVQDVAEDERGNYTDLIRYFLMLKDSEDTKPTNGDAASKENGSDEATANMKPFMISKSANNGNFVMRDTKPATVPLADKSNGLEGVATIVEQSKSSKSAKKKAKKSKAGSEDPKPSNVDMTSQQNHLAEAGVDTQVFKTLNSTKKRGKKGKTASKDPEQTTAKQADMESHITAPPVGIEVSKTPTSAKRRAKKSNVGSGEAEPATVEKATEGRGASNIEMETQAQMRSRLREGVLYHRESGMYIAGTVETPLELVDKAAPMPEDEIDTLLEDIAKIKTLLFCRLLLSHAKLLPVALRVDSIEELLQDAEVSLEDLRDLCLKIEKPALQEVRDACADFARGDGEEDNSADYDGPNDDEVVERHDYFPARWRKELHPGSVYQTKREKEIAKQRKEDQKITGMDDPGAYVDFGVITDEGEFSKKKMRIKVCGHYIHNYPSEKAMNRGGWFHFCVIAKDSNLFDAITLCRHWDEFYELNVLATYHYFPGTNWMTWVGDRLRGQLMSLGFIPYFQTDVAHKFTYYFQSGRNEGRRTHNIREMRNFICGHIKRNDAASRRLIQYLSMATANVIVLVRDAKTGHIVVTPPKEQLWLVREKIGYGRASKNDYHVLSEVGTKFFEEMDHFRRWHFGFADYYDVYVWDAEAGTDFAHLYNQLQQMLAKAHRFVELREYYKLASPILKTLTRDKATMRARTIKPGEKAMSIWDEIIDPRSTIRAYKQNQQEVKIAETVKYHIYNQADVLEDEILFPEEMSENRKNELFKENPSSIVKFERGGPQTDIRRFAYDLDSEDDIEDMDKSFRRRTEGKKAVSQSTPSNWPSDGEVDDNDDEWTDESESMSSSEGDGSLLPLHHGFMEKLTKSMKEGRIRDFAKPLLENRGSLPSSIHKIIDADIMATMRLSLTKTDRDYGDYREETLRREYDRFMDRERSKVFKDCWHKADLTPGAAEKYAELLQIVRKMDDFQMSKINMGPYEMLAFMGMASRLTEHRRIIPDAFLAYAGVSMFFETFEFIAFAFSDSRLDFSKSLLLNQTERAKRPPKVRTYKSNRTIGDAFFKEWNDLHTRNRRRHGAAVDDIYPLEWDIAIRPIIARLYKTGVICNSYCEVVCGRAVAIAEPDRPMDLYIDYRLEKHEAIIPPSMQDPTGITPETLLDHARIFAAKNPGACFSILRLWSAPHFYPLMVGMDRREYIAFMDSVGRAWEWKFVPKDMPYSEWSIHRQAQLRIEPYKKMLGNKVVVKRDLYLVMGNDADECRLLSAAVTWAVQTEPWRLEVDFWRSFVGIDLKFLQGLQRAWLE